VSRRPHFESSLRKPVQHGQCAILLGLMLIQCRTDVPLSGETVAIVVSKKAVTLEPTERGLTLNMKVTLTNLSNDPILWSECEYSLEQYRYTVLTGMKEEEWIDVWRPACTREPDDRNAPLRSGESVSIDVSALALDNASTDFSGEPGVYRFRFFLSVQSGDEFREIPRGRSVSESFTLLQR
jgi:hypothetical protein